MSTQAPVWKRFCGGLAVGTLGLSGVAVGGFVLCSGLAASGVLPIWAAALLNTIFAYLAFTPAHEAAHGNIHGTHARLKWLNELIGWACAGVLLAPFSAFRVLHLTHHSHTNDSERDPDYWVAGPPSEVAFRCLTILPHYYWDFIRGPTSRTGAARKKRWASLWGALVLAAGISLGSWLGYGGIILTLWVIPAVLASSLLALVFDWLPHVPHVSTERYLDTRVLLFPGLELLLVGQNYHLIHHLYPRIPFYRYAACFRTIRPTLEAEGANITELWPLDRLELRDRKG